jgi:hypothetical protein
MVNNVCRICSGDPPNHTGFSKFEQAIIKAARAVKTEGQFIDKAVAIDQIRFNTGDEWGEPQIANSVRRLVFSNPDPDQGLLLFTLGCWLDMQAKYTVVWNRYLQQAKNWIDGKGSIPRGNFAPTTTHLMLTKKAIEKYGNISQWFIQKIGEIAESRGKAKGNIYRLAGQICSELYAKPEVASWLENGILPRNFSGGDHKRFWMFLMFLRRDNSVVKCLFTRALSKFEGGQKAAQTWYDPEYFDPIECELPVDTWVLKNWNKTFEGLGIAELQTEETPKVAVKARLLAHKNNLSPSVFDALLFYSVN